MSRYFLYLLALPLVAAPQSAPKLDPPRAGAQIVSGHAAESAWPVRVKVFDSQGNLIQQRDVLVDPSDSSIVAGFKTGLAEGQIVQASFVVDQAEMMASPPLIVGSVTPDKSSTDPKLAAQIAPTAASNTDPLALGRVRYYFTSGVVLSSDHGFQLASSGTQSALFLGLSADRSWLPLDTAGFRRLNLNTYFDTRLTSVPTQSADVNALTSFTQSEKATAFETGVYLPWIVGEPWQQGQSSYSLFAAPLAKAGFVTLTDAPATPLPVTGDYFKFYSYGARLGVFEHFDSKNAAPKMVSFVDITVGRFGDFEAFRDVTPEIPDSPEAAPRDFRRVRPWRYSFEGLLKLPHSPLVVGFDANVGAGAWPSYKDATGVHAYTQPRDDLRFLLGAQFDFSKLLKSLPQL